MGPSSGTCGARLSWTLTDGVLNITGSGAMASYSSSSGAPWEARKSSILTIVIQDGVTSIGGYAFNGCSKLTEVSIPGSVRFIGENSFGACAALESISVPTGVTEIDSNAFNYCQNLKNVNLPATLTSIGNRVFNYCSKLPSIVIPDSVVSMGEYVFADCQQLASVRLSSGLQSIANGTFRWCYALPEITIPEGISTIGSYAFDACRELKAIELPGSIENIQYGAFSTAMTDVYYPKTRADAEKIVFGAGNTGITGATWHFEIRMVPDLSKLNVLNLPTGLKKIEANAFEWLVCDAVIVPDGCTSIGSGAFANCKRLIYISIPSGTTVAPDAFDGCYSGLFVDRR